MPEVEKEIGEKATAMARFDGEYFHVEPATSFSIKDTDRVFTVGSCFARSVESALVKNKIDVIGLDFMSSFRSAPIQCWCDEKQGKR